MKLRSTHNSIRIRIRKSELLLLKQQTRVEEQVQFPNGILFKFVLSIDQKKENVDAALENHELLIALPEKEAKAWMNSNHVGIERQIALPDGEHLHLLIEKDFPCTDREEEDKSDTFWELATDKPEVC